MENRVVLAIEDCAADEFLIREAFYELDPAIEVRVAKDGEEAMGQLRREGEFASGSHVDLILLDLNLPKVPGKDLIEQIRSIVEYRLTPILILSSSRAVEEIHQCYALGANCYLCKPVELQDFFGMIKSVKRFWLDSAELPDTRICV